MTDERRKDADEGLHFGPVSRSTFATSTWSLRLAAPPSITMRDIAN